MKLYSAFLVNPRDNGTHSIEIFPDGTLGVDEQGRIQFVGTRAEARERFANVQNVGEEYFPHAVLMPGFVDTHVHLPQYQAAAIGTGELLDWLNTYIFPLEARFADAEYARTQSERFFADALSVGTTTMSVYCSSQRQAAEAAFEAALQAGIRVCMGKTMMDFGAPKNILFSAEQNIADSLAVANSWHNADDGRLQYTLTPRFAGSCSRELLAKTGEIARSENLRIQTHLSENPAELRYIASLFPEAASYTDVYSRAGMLTEQTLMAHSIYLSTEERMTLKEHDCALSHCPCSNRFLQSGVMPLRKSLQEGFRIGLGSDVAGGFSLSMLNEAKEAAESSKTWNIIHKNLHGGEELPAVTAEEALWLATLGGAKALGLDGRIGNFVHGKEADFIVITLDSVLPQKSLFQEPAHVLARLVYGGHTASVVRTYIRGKQVFVR